MHSWIIVPLAAVVILLFSGCTVTPPTNNIPECLDVETPAQGPKGDCIVFPNNCIPEDWVVVGECVEEVDLCQNVSCLDKCEGTTYLGDGQCVEGECAYVSVQENSPSCPEPVDLCEGITCHDKCDNGIFYGEGSCSEGLCDYDTIELDSLKCNEFADLELSVERKHCFYDPTHNFYSLFYQIKNIGENPVSPTASIWVVGDDVPGKKFRVINEAYTKNQVLWQESKISPYPYKGQEWQLRNLEQPTFIDYELIYCEVNILYDECTSENGLVLDRASTVGCPVNGWDLNAGAPHP